MHKVIQKERTHDKERGEKYQYRNWSFLKETNSEYSLEGLMRKLKLQYFGHLM